MNKKAINLRQYIKVLHPAEGYPESKFPDMYRDHRLLLVPGPYPNGVSVDADGVVHGPKDQVAKFKSEHKGWWGCDE